MGFEEIPHTADWSIRVWAADMNELLVESARGMYWLAGAELAKERNERRTIQAVGADSESLLVAFLSELVYFADQESVGFDDFAILIENDRLNVKMKGARFISLDKAIKAVTWHNLEIQKTSRGMEVEIVFDV